MIENGFGNSTGATMNLSSSTPATFSLYQNQPNPTSGLTVISYSLSTNSHVKLDIYDVAGQLLNILVDENQEAGSYQVVWDGKDNTGKEVIRGVYFYKLKADKFTATKKLILLR